MPSAIEPLRQPPLPPAKRPNTAAGAQPGVASLARLSVPDAEPGMPLFRAVKRELLRCIEQGVFEPGQALPSEATLARALGVAVGTLRQAVGELVAEHIVVRRQGRGTFVATHSADRFLFQFFHVERSDGLREVPQVELIGFERSRADDEVAEALSLRAGDAVFHFANRLRLQGRVVVHDAISVPAALFKGLSEKRLLERPGTLYQLYQSDYGISVLAAEERARAVAADRTAARVLGLAPGTPVLRVRRRALSFGGKPVELRLSTIHTAQHDYVQTFSRPR